MGQVIGQSDERGEDVANRPLSPQDVVSTVYNHLGINGSDTYFPDRLDRPMPLIADGEPIRELV